MDRTVNVIENLDGKKTVIIQDIRFRGKRNINWTDVERYLVEFIGDIYYIAENNNEEIYIGLDLPSEYTGSIYTKHLKGTVAKAKANASVGIPQLIEIATNPRFEKNTSRSTLEMLSSDGIDMILDLHYRYLEKMVKLTGSMSFMQVYLSGMRRMEENIFMIL